MLQLLSLGITVDEFLAYIDILTLDPTQADPPKTENYVTQPDPTRPNLTH